MTVLHGFGGAARLPRNVVLVGDALEQLARLPTASVDCVITSPPYFSLRNYGHARQIGLEGSVHEWVARLVAVMDEIARVLKPEGVVWLNVGDSFARREEHGAPPKGLVLAPERLLLALAARGWRVRNKVVWAKPNPMPGSARDRLTCAHERLFLLVRSRQYFFDLDAIRVPHRSSPRTSSRSVRVGKPPAWAGPLAGNQSGLDRLHQTGKAGHPLGKNPGDVWTIPTSTFRGGHHATYPAALVERPLLATVPERICVACGRAWRRERLARTLGALAVLGALRPDCRCGTGWGPGLVLDPFLGSGTTAVVAERLGRDWLGIELNPAFAALAEERIARARTAGPAEGAA